jgi:hypothetical protein
MSCDGIILFTNKIYAAYNSPCDFSNFQEEKEDTVDTVCSPSSEPPAVNTPVLARKRRRLK